MTTVQDHQPQQAAGSQASAGIDDAASSPESQAGPSATDARQAEVRWLTDDQQVAWRSFLLGSARLFDALTRQLEGDARLSLNEYEVLVRLSETEHRTLRMSELAASLVHSRSRLTHTVSRLESRGLVRRETCLVDGRGVNCVMTDEGFALLESAAPGHVNAVRSHLIDVLSDEQLRVLGEAMAVVADGARCPAPPAA